MNRITIPDLHVLVNLKELISSPRLIWMKIKMKKKLAVFMWINRSSKPKLMFRVISIVELNASLRDEL